MNDLARTRTRAWLAGTVAACLLLASGCLPTTASASPWFGTAIMGTSAGPDGEVFATTIRILLGYTGDITQLDITVTGPDDFQRTERLTSRRPSVLLQVPHYDVPNPPASGAYQIRVTGDGGDETWTIDFDATASLPPIPSLDVVTATTTTVEVSWDLVSGARTYDVALFERQPTGGGMSIPPSAILVDPKSGSHTFSDLDLDPGNEYWVVMLVLDGVDRFDPTATPRQLNQTRIQTNEFSPEALD